MNINFYTIYTIDRLLDYSGFSEKADNCGRTLFFTNRLPKIGDSIQGIEVSVSKDKNFKEAIYTMLTQKPNCLDWNYQKVTNLKLIHEGWSKVRIYEATVEDIRLIGRIGEITIIAEDSPLIFDHLSQ